MRDIEHADCMCVWEGWEQLSSLCQQSNIVHVMVLLKATVGIFVLQASD